MLISSIAFVFAPEFPASGLIPVHLRIQSGKEEILEYRLIVGALLPVCKFEKALELQLIKEIFWDKPLFLYEPDEDEPCYQTDNTCRIPNILVLFSIIREFDIA
ncbi:MAG: hypothetical protein KGZ88_17795 [Methylomicrobium sp.]|nr:hypothetical protein [Methylomicrobium sp.]